MPASSNGLDPYVPERGELGYDVLHYDLDLKYSINSNRLDGRARITIRPTDGASASVLTTRATMGCPPTGSNAL